MKKYKLILLVIGFLCSIFCTYFLTEKYTHINEFDGTIIKITGDTYKSHQEEMKKMLDNQSSTSMYIALIRSDSRLHCIQITTNYGIFELIGDGIAYEEIDTDVDCLLRPRDENAYTLIVFNNKTGKAKTFHIFQFYPDTQKFNTLSIFGKIQYKYLLETIPPDIINFQKKES